MPNTIAWGIYLTFRDRNYDFCTIWAASNWRKNWPLGQTWEERVHIWGKTQFVPGSFNYSTLNYGASLVAQLVKNPPAMWDTGVQSSGWEDFLEEGMATNFRRKKVFKLLDIGVIFQEQELTMSPVLEVVLTVLKSFSQCPVTCWGKRDGQVCPAPGDCQKSEGFCLWASSLPAGLSLPWWKTFTLLGARLVGPEQQERDKE